jgi:hypothetical protein
MRHPRSTICAYYCPDTGITCSEAAMGGCLI